MKIKLSLLLILISVSYQQVFATTRTYSYEKGRGNWWYQGGRTVQEGERQSIIKKLSEPSVRSFKDIDLMTTSEINEEYTALDKEIIDYPTNQKAILVERSLALKKEGLNRNNNYAELNAAALLKKPELGFAFEVQTSHLGTQSEKMIFKEEAVKLIKEYKDKIALVFFFTSWCQICHKFAPVIKNYGQETGLKIIPVSGDGKPIPDFLEYKINQGEMEAAGVKNFPAVYLFYDDSKPIFLPLSQGYISHDQLTEQLVRTLKVITKEQQ